MWLFCEKVIAVGIITNGFIFLYVNSVEEGLQVLFKIKLFYEFLIIFSSFNLFINL